MCLVVRMRDELSALFAKEVRSTDVVHVSLGEEDVAERRVVDGVEVALVNRRLEAHPGVDDDATLGRRDQERIGQAFGQVDEVVDLGRFGLRRRLDLVPAGA